jgi:hypothetical protein
MAYCTGGCSSWDVANAGSRREEAVTSVCAVCMYVCRDRKKD